MMNNIIENIGSLYQPVKALLVYKGTGLGSSCYVEAYDMDENGSPVNAHPLSLAEGTALAKSLDTSGDLKRSFLKPRGLMPENILYINPDLNGNAIWFTPAMERELFFVEGLDIPNGLAKVPPLIWKATKDRLCIYAFKSKTKPDIATELYHAPFLNMYQSGKVCMGTVKVKIKDDCMLEDFMEQWQQYFFNSYFSHSIDGHNPVKGNICQLWKETIEANKKIPSKSLIKTTLTLKNILS
ncbi:MAG: PRTRC system protein B [Chitinophagaceae bacterium]